MSLTFSEMAADSPILPVLHMETISDAINVTKAIYQGGITSVEVVLRSPIALDCITAIREQLPEVNVGVGTLTNPQQVTDAVNAGAQFLVSPSFTPTLAQSMLDTKLPMLPGIITPSEITQALEMGINELKFFPAAQFGGINTLKALSSVFQQAKFCPTGGINSENLSDFFALKNVFAVGGSWMASNALVKQQNWNQITQLSQQAISQLKQLDKCA